MGGVPRAGASLGQARFRTSRRIKISLSNLGIVVAGLGALGFGVGHDRGWETFRIRLT